MEKVGSTLLQSTYRGTVWFLIDFFFYMVCYSLGLCLFWILRIAVYPHKVWAKKSFIIGVADTPEARKSMKLQMASIGLLVLVLVAVILTLSQVK